MRKASCSLTRAVTPDRGSSSRDGQEKQLRRQLKFGHRYSGHCEDEPLFWRSCLAALTVVVLFGNVLTDALSNAQSGLTKLLAFLNWNLG